MGLIQKQLPVSANKFHGSQSAHYRREIRNPKVFATNINRSIVETCSYCQQEHRTNECESFLTLGRDDALKFLTENKLCFGCADSAEHIARNCRSRSECAKCGKRHLTALHVEKENPTTEGNASARCTEVCANGIDNSMILPVRIRSNRSPKEIVCYCIIDEQSNACFMSDELRELLECPGVDTNLTISTVLKSNAVISCKGVDDLEVLSFNKDECVKLPPVYTRECIPASDSQIPRPEVARKWPHLEPISDEIFPFQPKAKVSLLIGNNVPRVVRPRKIISGGEDESYAQKSILGWGIIGTVCRSNIEQTSISHRVFASQATTYPSLGSNANAKLVFSTKAEEVINPSRVNQMFELDFMENKINAGELSVEDRKLVTILSEGIRKDEKGHYIMPLPLKPGHQSLTNNRNLAMRRLEQLKRRFRKHPKFMEDYVDYMKEVLANWAERVSCKSEVYATNESVNYLPHTGVYHPRKPEKIRVVFDCLAEFAGVALNDYLLTGPYLMNGMLGVLCRFRKEEVAFSADI